MAQIAGDGGHRSLRGACSRPANRPDPTAERRLPPPRRRTTGEWSGVLARLTVRDTGVRAGTLDFVATRFMAKRDSGRPGWPGWRPAGRRPAGPAAGKQRVYTYDTNRDAWTFYDQYELADGDQIWISVHDRASDGPTPPGRPGCGGATRWHLLTSQELPLTGRAQVEQYVEVHVDGAAGTIAVPPDRGRQRAGQGRRRRLRYWRRRTCRPPSSAATRRLLPRLDHPLRHLDRRAPASGDLLDGRRRSAGRRRRC